MEDMVYQYVFRFRIPILLTITAVVVFIIAAVLWVKTTSPPPIVISESSVSVMPQTVSVDISGQVKNPGVYQLPEDSRVEDLLIAAGGILPTADDEFIAKVLNRAQKVSDGAKIYIPKKGEIDEQLKTVSTKEQQGSVVNALININKASLAQLDGLAGIGQVTARKIIDARPYQRTEELREKKIVNQSVWEKIKDKISVY